MESIRIDPSKLLGFKIIAKGNGADAIARPKVGTKQNMSAHEEFSSGARLSTKIGAKIGAKGG